LSVVCVILDLYGTLVDWLRSVGSFIDELTSSDAVGELFKRNIEQAHLRRPRKRGLLNLPSAIL
jgi:hypothetical protein